MKSWLPALALAALSSSALSTPASASQHVRVVLDTSGSMNTNDQPRLAILSTLLLYDLANLERQLGDSFEVLTFAPQQEWADPSAAPPLAVGQRIKALFGQRETFVKEVSRLPYDGRKTYFYPGIRAATEDLERARQGPADVLVLVLVTDGVPEEKTRDAELELLLRETMPRLEAAGIRFSVLAFGSEASRHRNFFDRLVRGSTAAPLGQVFVDATGSELLATMSDLFAQGFGYTRSSPRPVGARVGLDLDGGIQAERAAVVVLATSAAANPPDLRLAPPSGGRVNTPGGRVSARTDQAGYALSWVLSPDPGPYTLTSGAPDTLAVVLRPSRVQLEVRLPPGQVGQARQVMARSPTRWQVVVRPQGGATGDPGQVDLSYRAQGPRRPFAEPGSSPFEWSGSRQAPPAGAGQGTPEGRIFDIEAEFPQDPAPGQASYRGYLELEARRGRAMVGSLLNDQAFAVDVFPFLAIVPLPLAGDALPEGPRQQQPRALGRGERGCARFRLEITGGRLPHAEKPRWSVAAGLGVATQAFDRELAGALFTLNGQPLAIAGSTTPTPNGWQGGLELGSDDLLGEHELCVQVGRPQAGDPAKVLELPLQLTLLESPYDRAPVVEPFVFRVRIHQPSFSQRWGAILSLALAALVGLLSLGALARRGRLPGDLAYALRREEEASSTGNRAWKSLAFERPLGLTRWFSVAPSLPLLDPEGNLLLGRVRAGKAELFSLQTAAGVRVQTLDGRPMPSHPGGRYALEIHRPYRLLAGQERYQVRLEYRAERTP